MPNKGFTFLEIVITLTIFTVAMLGFFQILRTGMVSSYRATNELIATNLVRGLMAEIMSKNFEEPGSGEPPPALGEDDTESCRSGCAEPYDDVDDYDAYNQSPPITIGNVTMGGRYADFRRSVTVVYCQEIENPPGSGNFDIVDDLSGTVWPHKHVYVTASGPYTRDIVLDGLKVK